MKKLFSLLLAMIMAFIGSTVTNNNTTDTAHVGIDLDRPATTKMVEWARGYAARTVNYKKNCFAAARRQAAWRRLKKFAIMTATLPLMPLIGIMGHGSCSVSEDRVLNVVEELKKLHADKATEDDPDELEIIRLNIERLIDKLNSWSKPGSPASPKARVLSGAMLQAKPWLPKKDAEPKEGARQIVKVPKSESWSYKLLDLGDLTQFLSWSNKDGQHGLRAINTAMADGNVDEAVRLVNELDEALIKKTNSGKPFRIKADAATIKTGRRSLAAEIFGVEPKKLTDKITTASYDLANFVNNKALAKRLGVSEEQGRKRLVKIVKRFIYILQAQGVTLLDAGSDKKYILWASSNGMMKEGEAYFIEEKKLNEVETDFAAKIPGFQVSRKTTGAQILKERANMFTPSRPIAIPGTNEEKFFTIRDIILMPSVTRHHTFKKAIVADENGMRLVANHKKNITPFDGAMFVNPTNDPVEAAIRMLIMAAQFRFAGGKGAMHNCPETAMGINMPDVVYDVDGIAREWRKYTFSATSDIWKWNKMGLSWSQMQDALDELSVKYPTINLLREVRRINSADEKERRMSWQLVQQFILASKRQLATLAAKGVKRLNNERYAHGAYVRYAGLRKAEEERTALDRIFGYVMELVADKHLDGDRKRRWMEDLSLQATKPVMSQDETGYPFIITDPVAYWQVVFAGMDPDRNDLGFLAPGECNIANAKDWTKVLFNRCPSNAVCGRLLTQVNNVIYKNLGNVAVFAYGSEDFVVMDADEDGDESIYSTNSNVIDMFMMTMNRPNYPVIFDHLKGQDVIINNKDEQHDAIAEALVNANAYGSLVGRLSNASKAWLAKAGNVAMTNMDPAKKEKAYSGFMENANWCNIGTILAIDLTKTGAFPAWLQEVLNDCMKYAGKAPWSQRFNRATLDTPWFDEVWDGNEIEAPLTKPESLASIDRLAREVVNGTNGGQYWFDNEGLECTRETINMLMSHNVAVPNQGSKVTIDPKILRSIECRNYKGSDGAVIVHAREGKPVSIVELAKFLWRNAAHLSYTCKNTDERTADGVHHGEQDPREKREFYDYCRNLLLSWCEDDLERQKLVNFFVRHAFELPYTNGKEFSNNIGKDEKTQDAIWAKKGSWTRFILTIFQEDILWNVENNLDVPAEQRVAHPELNRDLVEADANAVNAFMFGASKTALF